MKIPSPDTLTKPIEWHARWVWLPDEQRRPVQRCWFRKDLQIHDEAFLQMVVSADSRYRLWLDDQVLGMGPPAGDLSHYHYDHFGDGNSCLLKPGDHRLVVEVISYGNLGPLNEIHARGGLLVQGEIYSRGGHLIESLSTPGDWRVMDDNGYSPCFDGGSVSDTGIPTPFGYSLGFAELVDLRHRVACPFTSSLDHECWQPCTVGERGQVAVQGIERSETDHWLEASPVPQPELQPQLFFETVRGYGSVPLDAWEALRDRSTPVTIPPHTEARVVLGQEQLTTAYPRIGFANGRDSSIRIVYAEAFSQEWQKGIRDASLDQFVEGYSDLLCCDGEQGLYMPMRWQTFRYIELRIKTLDTPLIITQCDSLFRAYPLKRVAEFECDHSIAKPLWDMSWRTLRLCSHDHFIDCPYYEQLQYMGDGLIQSLVAFNVAGDCSLWRRLLRDMDRSRLQIGLTQSRYPSRVEQVIPTFSLLWIRAIQLYDLYVGDKALIRELLPGVRSVLRWFTDRLDQHGLFVSDEGWQFVDWVEGWPQGDLAVAVRDPNDPIAVPSVTINLQLLDAIEAAGQLALRAEMDVHEAAGYHSTAIKLRQQIQAHFWSSQRELWSENPSQTIFTEHANCLAINAEFCDADASSIVRRLLEQSGGNIAQCSLYFQHYFAMAMTKAGQTQRVWERLETWRSLLRLKLSTLPEQLDAPSHSSRSDCHGWSAWPALWFLRGVLGIHPLEPGYQIIGIKPQLGSLRYARGQAYTPHGSVHVDVAKEKDGFRFEAQTPPGVRCLIELPDGSKLSHDGGYISVRSDDTIVGNPAPPRSSSLDAYDQNLSRCS